TRSKAPLTESFGTWSNGKIVLLALFGATAGQAVVWYAGQFYALFFMTQTLKVDPITANLFIAAALAIATGGFVFFGWLSDKIGRKPIIMAGCLLAALTYFPLFKGLMYFGNPALYAAAQESPAVVIADPKDCSFEFVPGELKSHVKVVDSWYMVKDLLHSRSVTYDNEAVPAGSLATVRIGDIVIQSVQLVALSGVVAAAAQAKLQAALARASKTPGHPLAAD